MDIIIHSLYSDKDIFFRVLVSNAADACDKVSADYSDCTCSADMCFHNNLRMNSQK